MLTVWSSNLRGRRTDPCLLSLTETIEDEFLLFSGVPHGMDGGLLVSFRPGRNRHPDGIPDRFSFDRFPRAAGPTENDRPVELRECRVAIAAMPVAVPGGPGESSVSRPTRLVWSEPMRAASHLDQGVVLLLELAQYVVQSNLPQLGIVILYRPGHPRGDPGCSNVLMTIGRTNTSPLSLVVVSFNPVEKKPEFRQHRLNNRPLPHGHGSLRPSFSFNSLSPWTCLRPRLTSVSLS